MVHLKKLLKQKKGFTLIELIVVLAILAIIALLAIPRFTGTLENAKLKTDQATARTIVSAIALYEAQEGSTADLEGDVDVPAVLTTKGYLEKEPVVQSGTGGDFDVNITSGKVTSITGGGVATPFYSSAQ